MTSHAWMEDNTELEDAITRFQQDNNLPDGFAIWVCTLANYQANANDSIQDIGPTIAEQLALDPFTLVIQSDYNLTLSNAGGWWQHT